jgi:muramidase (phage lysozyme)
MAQFSDDDVKRFIDAVNNAQTPLDKFRSGLENLSEEEKKAAITAQKYAETNKLAIAAVAKLAQAAANTASQLYNGQKGAGAFNGALDGMSGAVQTGSKAIATLIPGAKGAAMAFSLATQAVTAYAKAANTMADGLYKGYQGLAKSGAAASDGMSGLFNDAKKLGLSMNELDDYVKLIGENARDLALFSGSVFQGRQRFADINKMLDGPVKTGLMNLGMSVQEIADGTMGYLRIQTRLGRAQNMTNNQLAEGAARYLKEQDALAKVTGQSRKEMEDATERALQGEQFAAKIRQLQMSGQGEAAEKLIEMNKMYGAMGPETQAAFQATVTGNLANADAQKAYRASQGEMMASTQRVIAGQQSAADAVQGTMHRMGQTADQLGTTLGQVGAYNKTFGSMYEQQKGRQLAEGNLTENLRKAAEEQKRQGAEGGAAADAMVSNQVKLVQTQIEINKALETFVKDGIIPTQKAMQLLADTTLAAANKATSGGPKGVAGFAGTAAGAAGGAKLGMMLGAAGGPIGSLIGALIGGAAGGMLGKSAADAGSDAIGLPGRSSGSMGATGKLIEDFGKGTPMMLHGREGVITEKQLQEFGNSAMAAGMGITGSTGKAGVMGAPDRQIAKLIQENRQALDKQVTTEEKILTAKTDYYEFIVDQLNAIELNATHEKKISAEDLKNIKDFSKTRDQLLDDILNNIKQQATLTKEATGATAAASSGGGGSGGGGSSGGGGGGGSSGGAGGGGSIGASLTTPSGNVVGRLLEYIGKKESNGNYNILVGGKTEPNLTNMTIAEVLEYQRGMRQRGHESTAVGKYQIIRGTLESLIKEGYAGPDDKFSASIQDRLAVGLLKRRGLEKYQAGKLSKDQFADNLSKEWASLPYNTGQSYYAGVGSNKSSGSRNDFMTAFARNGGTFNGPEAGYPAILHGPEAVVPLPDGKSIPVTMPGGGDFSSTAAANNMKTEMGRMMTEFKSSMQMMMEQMNSKEMLDVMNEMVKVQKTSTDIQKKMLQAQS